MNSLCKLYAVSFSMLDAATVSKTDSPEVAMVAITAVILLSKLATAFYVRFLIAMCKESKGQRICHLIRLRPNWGESAAPADQAMEVPSLRAA